MKFLPKLFKARYPEIPLAPKATTQVEALTAQLQAMVRDKAILESELKGRPKHLTDQKVLGKEFAVVLPFAPRDIGQTIDLVKWWRELETDEKPMDGIILIIIAPNSVGAGTLGEIEHQASKLGWKNLCLVRPPFDLPDEKWPIGSCWSFLNNAQFCLERRFDFFWNEPDCIAIKPGWAKALREAFTASAHPYVGWLEPGGDTWPAHMTGCGIYTWEVGRLYNGDKLGEAFDIILGPTIQPLTQQTPLIHHLYDEPGAKGQPPRFETLSDLNRINDGAVVFHRNKDGRLINLLRERLDSK